MSIRRNLWLWVFGVFILVLAAGCTAAQPPAPKEETAPAAEVKPRYGGTWRVPNAITATTDADPHRSLCCAPIWGFVGDRLITADSVTGKLSPELAEKWEVSKDYLTYTFYIRKGVKWHNKPPVNGRELTAEDVAYSLMRIAGKVNPDEGVLAFPRSTTMSGMKKAEAVDRYTVKVTMDSPNVGFLAGVSDGRNQMVPKEMVDQFKQKLTDGCKANIGTGPFIMDNASCEPGVGFKAVKNPDYWGKDAQGNPMPYLEAIQAINITDRPAAIAALVAGQIDIQDQVLYSDAQDAVKSNPNLKIIKYLGLNQLGWVFNVEREPYSDVRVRQALNLALSRQEIGNTYHGEGNWFLPSWVPRIFTDYATPADVLEKQPGLRANKTEDIKRAKELLKEAGYANGFTVRLTAAGGSPGILWGFLEIPQIIKKQLERDLGDLPNFKVELDWRTGGKINPALTTRDLDTVWWGWTFEHDPGLVMHVLYNSEGGRNYGAFSDPVYDKMWAEQQREFDPKKRKEIFDKMAQRLSEQAPMALTIQYYFFGLLQPSVKGYPPGPFGTLSTVHNWSRYVWLEK